VSEREDEATRVEGYLLGEPEIRREVDGWIRIEMRQRYAGLASEHHDLGRRVHEKLLVNLRAGRFRSRSPLRTYVTGIAHRTAIDRVRQLRRRREMLVALANEPPCEASDDLSDTDRLHRAILAVPAACRDLWRLVFVEELGYDEIGRRLSIPGGTVKSRVYHCGQGALAAGDRRLTDMTADHSLHELLPWYMTGTLEPQLAEEFREHLATCDACRREMAALEKLRGALAEHGDAFLDDHPTAEDLVAATRGEAAAGAERTRRHLALCTTCAEEATWVTGESEYRAAPGATARLGTVGRPFGWAAAIAAMLLMASVPLLWLTQRAEVALGVVNVRHLESTQRGAMGRNVYAFEPDETAIRMIALVDIAPDRFPLSVALVDGDGETILRQPIRSLLDGYLLFDCPRKVCSTGRYALEIYGAGATEPELTFDFETVEP
jgi:RNA polymerase sigma factor (sigma-70 family)